jgi:hypothetical protein
MALSSITDILIPNVPEASAVRAGIDPNGLIAKKQQPIPLVENPGSPAVAAGYTGNNFDSAC